MATNSRLARALQLRRIIDTSRKIIETTPTTSSTTSTTSDTPTVLKSLPKHKPLLPLLLSHNIPSKVAQACANRFDGYANQLRSETETKLVPYLVNRRKNNPSKVYSFFLDSYSQALRDWAQSILNAALRGLKRAPVEIRDLDVTYAPPLWLPLPLDLRSTTTQDRTQKLSSLSSITAPPHAFPTTYPPPLRPPRTALLVEWPRTFAASSSSPSTSAVDLDSLCVRFAKSLVIDENTMQPTQTKPSIFSLPNTLNGGPEVASLRTKRPKSRRPSTANSRMTTSQRPLTPPQKAVKPRQLSVPPSFPQAPPKVRSRSRKSSAPASTPPFQPSTVSGFLPTNPPPIFPPLAPPLSHTASLDMSSCLDFKTPRFDPPQALYDLGIGSTAPKTSNSPRLSSGPTTPPTLSSDLFSEPAVASPIPSQLSEPFLGAQFPLQFDLFPHDILIPPYNDAGSLFVLSPDGSSLKSGHGASISDRPLASFDSGPSMCDFFRS